MSRVETHIIFKHKISRFMWMRYDIFPSLQACFHEFFHKFRIFLNEFFGGKNNIVVSVNVVVFGIKLTEEKSILFFVSIILTLSIPVSEPAKVIFLKSCSVFMFFSFREINTVGSCWWIAAMALSFFPSLIFLRKLMAVLTPKELSPAKI